MFLSLWVMDTGTIIHLESSLCESFPHSPEERTSGNSVKGLINLKVKWLVFH